MSHGIGLLERFSCDFRVNLRCGDRRVTQQFLNKADISTSFEHMSSTGMPQCMWRHFLGDLRADSVALQYGPRRLARESPAEPIQEERRA